MASRVGFVRIWADLTRSAAPAWVAVIVLALAVAPASPEATELKPDRIVVIKSERKLMLMAGDSELRSMNISLGLMPRGPKRQEGDYRTPEGSYYIEAKNPNSDYFLSLKVSYPNATDREHARELGVDPGGQIMIHGLPNEPQFDEGVYSDWDWTDGCIAVSNSDMVDLWRLTSVAMPIEILP